MKAQIEIESVAVSDALAKLLPFEQIIQVLPNTTQHSLFGLFNSLILTDFSATFGAGDIGKLTLGISDDFELLISALRARDSNTIGDIELIAHIESLYRNLSG